MAGELFLFATVMAGECQSATTLTGLTGSITDGAGEYDVGADCTWFIQPNVAGTGYITLKFTEFHTESSYDVVRIFDGSNLASTKIFEGSGEKATPFILQGSLGTPPRMTVDFKSDGSVVKSGFTATYDVILGCGLGQYANHSDCIPCPGGTASNATDADSSSACLPCIIGTFATIGSSACSLCPAGTFSNPTLTACIPCVPGTASAVIGASNSSVCATCPLGMSSSAGSPQCIKCSPGWVPSGSVCIPCPVNWFANGTQLCSPCPPPSTYSNEASTSCVSVPHVSQTSVLVKKLLASDGASGDYFGYAVGVSGAFVVVGAHQDDDKGASSGSAWLFERDQVSGEMTEGVKLLPSDGAAYDSFGKSVAISGDVVVVGAHQDDDKGSSSGSASVFRRNVMTGSWNQEAKLVASDGAAYDYFGFAVAVSGHVIVVGAYLDDDVGSASGTVFVFEYDSTGKWTQTKKLHASDGTASDYFGYTVATTGNTIAVGAEGDDDKGSASGSVHIFERHSVSWAQTAKLTASDGAAESWFGTGLAMSGTTVVIGAYRHNSDAGAVYVFDRNQTGVWEQRAKLTASDAFAGDRFGKSVAISGDIIVVGAYQDDDKGSSSGSVYVYQRSGNGIWTQVWKIVPSDGEANGYFGYSVGVTGTVIVVGEYGSGSNSGAAFLYGCACGSYGIGSVCSLCPKFSSSSSVGSTNSSSCRSCAVGPSTLVTPGLCNCECQPGTFTNASKTGCVDCPPGTASNSSGMSTCTPCDDGTFATIGSSACSLCPSGTFSTLTACIPCVAGTASAVIGASNSSVCTTCPFGMSSSAGSPQCIKCSPGWVPSGSVCILCPVNWFANGTQLCSPCPPNTYSNEASTSCVNVPRVSHKLVLVKKLMASDGVSDDHFGHSVSASGNIVVVGSYGDADKGINAGSVHVLERSPRAGQWYETAKLFGPDSTLYDSFGWSVSVGSGTIAVGAYRDDDKGYDSGSAHVFKRSASGQWTHVAKLVASDGAEDDRFGSSVSADGDIVVVGAYMDDDKGSASGSAYIFEVDATTGSWAEKAKLLASDGKTTDYFGCDVAVSGKVVVVGAQGAQSDSGAAYIFERTVVSGAWAQTTKLVPSDPASLDKFGHAVAVSGHIIVIGAHQNDDNQHNSGSCYIFERGSSGTWSQSAKLVASDPGGSALFGFSVSVSGTMVVIGAPQDDNSKGTNSGSTYIFQRIDGTWSQTAKLVAFDGYDLDRFAYSVGVSGTAVVVGATDADSRGSNSGAAYLYGCACGTIGLGSVCSLCPKFSSSSSVGSTNSSSCRSCAVGPSTLVTPGLCNCECQPGTFTNASKTGCVDCPPGTASNSSGMSTCTPCDDGTFATIGSSACSLCPSGTFSTLTACIPCVAGTASAVIGASNSSVCTTCPFGTSSSAGSPQCIKCSPGWVPSGSVCIPCPVNWFANGTQLCSPCPPSTYSNEASTSCVNVPRVSHKLALVKKLMASDGAAADLFSGTRAISVSGNTIVAGSSDAVIRGMLGAGAAYVFERDPTTGVVTQKAKLVASDAAQRMHFGRGTCASGDFIVVGADGIGPGFAYIFERSPISGLWSQTTKLSASDGSAGDNFGYSVAIDGNFVVVGANTRALSSGAAYVFERVSNTWNQAAKLVASDGGSNDVFGESVAVCGNVAIIGAFGDDDKGNGAGAAYIFSRDSMTGKWSEKAKLLASDGASKDIFGRSVSIDGNHVVVGAHGEDEKGSDAGAAYVFERNPATGVWAQKAKLMASDASSHDHFGSSVAVSGSVVIVGASQERDSGYNGGAAYVFERISGTWKQTSKLVAYDGPDGSRFGSAVSASGTVVVVGALHDAFKGESSGAAYVFGCACGSSGVGSVCSLCPKFSSSSSVGSTNSSSCHSCAVGPSTLVTPGLCNCECQPGTFTNASKTGCVDCPPGTASNSSGMSTCTPCDDGTFATIGSSACSLCPAGTFSSPTLTTCIPCVPGTASAVIGASNSSVCTTCPFGTSSSAGSPQCIKCSPGWVPSGSVCTPCPVNWFANGTQLCSPCPPSTYSNEASTSCVNVPHVSHKLVPVEKLMASDGNQKDMFGVRVAASGTTVAVGSSSGVYIYERDSVSGDVTEIGKLAAAVNGRFGDVSVSGNVVAIGACENDDKRGVAFIFERDSIGKWTQTVKLVPPNGFENMYYGCSVAACGRTVVVGAFGDKVHGVYSGSAFVYERGDNGAWVQTSKLIASDGSGGDRFGGNVTISGDTIVVGAHLEASSGLGGGSIYIFERRFVGWTQAARFSSSSSQQFFGHSVSASGNIVAVGAQGGETSEGEAFIFERNVTWSQTAHLLASDASQGDRFGFAVACCGDTVAIGANEDRDKGYFSGSVYLFKRSGTGVWTQTKKILAFDGRKGDMFGTSLGLSGTTLVVGADRADSHGADSGAAYLYGCACGSFGLGSVCSLCPKFSSSSSAGSTNSSSCRSCAVGRSTLVTPGLCNCECQPGTFTNASKTGCVDCPPGTASATVGALNDSLCSRCPSGAASAVGSARCTQCMAGQYVGSNQGSCVNCRSGTFSTVVGATNSSVCQRCSPGTFAVEGSGSCRSCVAGYVALSFGSAACDPCAVDQYWIDSTSPCVPCPLGTYANAGSAECVAVPAGTRQYPVCLTAVLRPPDADDNAHYAFGYRVAVSGSVIVVAAHRTNDVDVESGVVYAFERNAVSGAWSRSTILRASDVGGGDHFGCSVSVSGNYILVGSCDNDKGGLGAGAATIFERNVATGQWTEKVILHASDAASLGNFGSCTAILSGRTSTAVVGATGRHAAYVFSRDAVTGLWVQEARLVSSDGSKEGFGRSCSISGDFIFVGNSHTRGAAFVFQRNATSGSWDHDSRLVASDGTEGDYFGYDLSVSGSVAVLGAHMDTDKGYASGSAYIYQRNSNGRWVETLKLVPADGQAQDRFGWRVSASRNVVTVGRMNSAVVYERDTITGSWKRVSTLRPTTIKSHMSVAASPSAIVVGAPAAVLARIATCCSGAQTLGEACRTCSAGTIAPITGSTNCDSCLVGTSSTSGSTVCGNCGLGSYNSMTGGLCRACPAGSICASAQTGVPVVCAPGTHNHKTGQIQCYHCPYPSRCVGGANCSAGYDGLLCGRCAIGYFAKGSECWKCPDVPIFLIIAMVVIFIISVMFLTLRISPVVVARFKQLLAFIQCFSLCLNIDIPWPPFVVWLQSFLASLYLDVDLASPECLIQGGVDWHTRFWLSLVFAGSAPALVLLVVCAIALIRLLLRQGPQPRLWNVYLKLTWWQIRLSRLFLLALSIAYVPLTKSAAKAFVCVSSANGMVLAEDTSISCSSPEHQFVQNVSIAIFVVVTGLLPISISLVSMFDIMRNRGKMDGFRSMERREIISTLFESYRPSHAYFEGIVMNRKAAFVLVTTAIAPTLANATLIRVLLVAISAIYVVIIVVIRPFAPVPVNPGSKRTLVLVDMLNWIEIAAASSILINLIASLIMSFFPVTAWTVGVDVAMSLIVSITGFAGIFVTVFPFVYKRIHAQSVFGSKRDKEDKLGLSDPRALLGPADGRWLLALQHQMKTILDDSTDMDPVVRIGLAGAYQVWLDRLYGRLACRMELLEKFNPQDFFDLDLSQQRCSEAHGVQLESLKFKTGRREAVKKLMREGSVGLTEVSL